MIKDEWVELFKVCLFNASGKKTQTSCPIDDTIQGRKKQHPNQEITQTPKQQITIHSKSQSPSQPCKSPQNAMPYNNKQQNHNNKAIQILKWQLPCDLEDSGTPNSTPSSREIDHPNRSSQGAFKAPATEKSLRDTLQRWFQWERRKWGNRGYTREIYLINDS